MSSLLLKAEPTPRTTSKPYARPAVTRRQPRNPSGAPGVHGRACSVSACERRATRRGWCGKHYARWRSTGNPTTATRRELSIGLHCSVNGCSRPIKSRMLCRPHYVRLMRYGDPLVTKVRKGVDLVEVVTGITKVNKTCRRCRLPFTSISRARYCSQKCWKRDRSGMVESKPCRVCGSTIVLKSSVTCSAQCAETYRISRGREFVAKAREKDEETFLRRRREIQRRRRARKIQQGTDGYSDADIYQRDSGICQLCRLPVPSDRRFPDPLSASIDHIVPISKGGSDTADNVQLAHLSCNKQKGSRQYVGGHSIVYPKGLEIARCLRSDHREIQSSFPNHGR
jgi:5-methylcytosine-specific restriction endonuclease McrA